MNYLVTGADGKEYGPVTVDQLHEWVRQDRIRPDTPLRDFTSGQSIMASAVPGLFATAPAQVAPADWSQPPMPPAAYPRTYNAQPYSVQGDDGKGVFWGVVFRSAMGIVLFFVFHGIGLIVAAYALFFAIRSKAVGHRFGLASILVAATTFLVILIGWIIRIGSGGSL